MISTYRKALPALRTAALMVLLGLLLAAPRTAAQGFAQGVKLCLRSILPALFPFFVVCNLLIAEPGIDAFTRPLRPLVRLWGVDSSAAPKVLLLSLAGGYAVCAQLVGRLRQERHLTAAQAETLLLLGCCSGPGFVIGCVGGLLLGSVKVGILLYGLQLAANLLSAACLVRCIPQTPAQCLKQPPAPAPSPVGLPAAVTQAVDSTLQVCGCTVFFTVLAAVLAPLLPNIPLVQPLLAAVLEISGGCAAFAALGGAPALYGLCLCLSIPGLSVFCQIAALLDGAVPIKRFLLSRLLHLFWLQILMRLCARVLPDIAAAASTLSARVIPMQRLPADAAVICFVFLCCTLYKLQKTHYNKR